MGKITRIVTIDRDEREPGKTLEEDAQGILARIAKIPGASVEDLGTDKVKLREEDDIDAIITAVEALAANIAQSAVVENEDRLREIEENPLLKTLQGQYEALSNKKRTYNGKIRSWEEVCIAIPNMTDFLAGVETLEQAKVYLLNMQGQLIVGDGCAGPPKETLGLNYSQSRTEATRISYLDAEGKIVIVDNDYVEVPSDAQILSERGLVNFPEYRRINKEGQFEKDYVIWMESGKNPDEALSAYWSVDRLIWSKGDPNKRINICGSRSVLRVNLNL
ncbi:hypothetical protein ACFL21_01620 [Patescibacteria group bacterium]